eukprot:548894-Pyramimonas_sp.AAC.1
MGLRACERTKCTHLSPTIQLPPVVGRSCAATPYGEGTSPKRGSASRSHSCRFSGQAEPWPHQGGLHWGRSRPANAP